LAISLSLLVSSNYFPACLDILIPGIGKKAARNTEIFGGINQPVSSEDVPIK